MPELWQKAIRLGISRKGKKAELIERIMRAQEEQDMLNTLEKLKRKMIRFEETKEELRRMTESASKLAPKLDDKRAILENSIHDRQEKIKKISDLVLELKREKEKLHDSILQLEAKISGIEQILQAPRLLGLGALDVPSFSEA